MAAIRKEVEAVANREKKREIEGRMLEVNVSRES